MCEAKMKRKRSILVVDDNAMNRELLSEILSDEYSVIEAENGEEAYRLLEEYQNKISLVLLDLVMPVLDGYGFLDRIKKDRRLATLPIIVMTGKGADDEEVRALDRGATDFVHKPYNAQVIRRRVASLIRLRETASYIDQYQYDRLTGLCTKEYFCELAEEMITGHPEKEYDIICFDIENFKLYNDIYGAEAGDRLLVLIADKMRTGRENNSGIVLNGRKIADRFISLVERGRVNEDMIRRSVDYICRENDTGSVVRIVFGAYQIEDRSIPVEKMIDRALMAASRIKKDYQKVYAVYDDDVRTHMLRERAISQEMEHSVETECFEVYFQPKFRFDNGRLAGAEALVRWEHPKLGIISPAEFIQIFEKNGFISRLDKYVWTRTCKQIREWKDRGLKIVPVSVNVSRANLYQEDLAGRIEELVAGFELDKSLLHLEITESYYMENSGKVLTSVEKLWNNGFVIELDDFGSGYSSLHMLSRMKLDFVKLDRQFIACQLEDRDKNGILKYTIEIVHNMGIGVIAEGVETREQAEMLKSMGCDLVQGYYYGKPMPAVEFEKLLTGR